MSGADPLGEARPKAHTLVSNNSPCCGPGHNRGLGCGRGSILLALPLLAVPALARGPVSARACFVAKPRRSGRQWKRPAATFGGIRPRLTVGVQSASNVSDDYDYDDYDDDEDSPPILPFLLDDTAEPGDFEGLGGGPALSRPALESLTNKELRQQIRLRGMEVSAAGAAPTKADLVDLLLRPERGPPIIRTGEAGEEPAMELLPAPGSGRGDYAVDMARRAAEASKKPKFGKKKATDRQDKMPSTSKAAVAVDVSAYLDPKDAKKDYISSAGSVIDADGKEDSNSGSDSDSGQPSAYGGEVWGEDAKIVDDYEGRSIIVDSLSRNVIEFSGHERAKAQAYVVASRPALREFLSGSGTSPESPEEMVRRIQLKKEDENRVKPKDFNDIDAADKGDEAGHYKNILERDYGDWGVYSSTGVQTSAQQVRGVLLLGDVRGPFHEDMMALADKIAFESQPVVVMAPDLFRGAPWEEPLSSSGQATSKDAYEAWRVQHDEIRITADIRAAAATLRKRYGVSSVAVFGTCYGGGRALEAAAGWQPPRWTELGSDAPPPVDPSTCVAWYPTRYDAAELFGPGRISSDMGSSGGEGVKVQQEAVAIMAVFAGKDELPGATTGDAEKLKSMLEQDVRVKDLMVKVFPGQVHGFAHIGMGAKPDEDTGEEDSEAAFVDEEFGGKGERSLTMDGGDAEVACLLSTAWMETYGRSFLPTTGVAIKDDDDQSWSDLEMKDLTEANQRDIRKEIENAMKSQEDVPLDLKRMPSYQYGNEVWDSEGLSDNLPKVDVPDMAKPAWEEKLNEVAEDLKRVGVSQEDDDEVYLGKIETAAKEGKLKSWLGDIDMENPPENIPKSNLGYNMEFGEKFMDAMDELGKIGLQSDDDLSTTMKKMKSAMERGELQGIQDLRKDRAKIREQKKTEGDERRAAAKEQLRSIGVTAEDDMDETYRKLKQAIDKGEFDKLRNAEETETEVGGGGIWDSEEDGPW